MNSESKNLLEDYIGVFRMMRRPSKFTAKTMTPAESVGYYLKASSVPAGLSMVFAVISFLIKGSSVRLGTLWPGSMIVPWLNGFGTAGTAVGIIISPALYFFIDVPLAMLFLAVLVYYPGKKLGLLKGKYSGSLSAMSYTASVFVSLIWALPFSVMVALVSHSSIIVYVVQFLVVLLPLLAVLVGFYSYYVLIVALSKQNRTSASRAFFGTIVALILLVLIVGLASAVTGYLKFLALTKNM